MSSYLSSFGENLNIVVIGAAGGIGQAFVELLLEDEKLASLHAFSRRDISLNHPKLTKGFLDLKDEPSIEKAAALVSAQGKIDVVIVATGLLHQGDIQPEKSLRDIDANSFSEVFAINSTGPALIMKHFLPHLSRDTKTVFAAISARVGSIADNHLGGWYAYRASKSALVMLLKTASVEVARRSKQACIIGLHPGTVDTDLSEPFKKNVAQDKLFTPEFSAKSLLKVINDVVPEQSGQVFDWSGAQVPY